ncbi:MAG TPA: polysaccharide biosynthesis protein, partial [Candidatus Polarisedimenticolia bacterium]|nr:polysaccharide biosynthesis protein [Candidatus Polarisedimenticolia bacterium]
MNRFRYWPLSKVNLALKMAADALLLSTAFAAAFWIRFDGHVPSRMWEVCGVALPWIVIVKIVLFYFAGLYRSFWRYSGINDLKRLLLAQGGGMAAVLFVVTMSREATIGFPRGIYLIDAILCLILTGGLRFVPRWLREVYPPSGTPHFLWSLPEWIHTTNTKGRRALLVGAGDGGEMILRETRKNPQSEILPIGFVDDDPRKQGREIHGVPVLGTQRDIPRLVEELGVEEILLTLPSASGREIQAILRSCSKVKTRLRIVPKLSEIVSGSARLTDIRDLRLEDLLRREKVNLNLDQISGSLRGKRILVTGAGGSIGSELCRQIAAFEPSELLLFG